MNAQVPPNGALEFAWRSVLKIHAGGLILSPAQLFTKISPFFLRQKTKILAQPQKKDFLSLNQILQEPLLQTPVSQVPLSSFLSTFGT